MLSPAKINLSLRILGKRSDGFHEIDTIMTKLPSLADEITISKAAKFSFTCSDPLLPTDETNLVVKAAQALSHAAGEKLPYQIHLQKVIPHGAGLGGGSSNAATTLLALNQYLSKPLDAAELLALAANIGADVPFFLYEGAARCTGKGEIITAVPQPAPNRIMLLKPAFSVATPDAYKNCLNAPELPQIPYEEQHFEDLILVNDLEKPVFAKYPYLAELKKWLLNRRDTEAVLMSGSGSTLFIILHRQAKARALISSARKYFDSNLWCWVGNL